MTEPDGTCTVGELIENLQRFPQDAKIRLAVKDDRSYWTYSVKHVGLSILDSPNGGPMVTIQSNWDTPMMADEQHGGIYSGPCEYCGRRIIGAKGDYWHASLEEKELIGRVRCADGAHLAMPKELAPDESR